MVHIKKKTVTFYKWPKQKNIQKERPEFAKSGLVIFHDELEVPLRQLKVKNGNSSAKGHNGFKSVLASLQGAGLLDQLGQNFVRIGVGIGRPVSRERGDVGQFVLGQMTPTERETVEDAAGADTIRRG